MFNLHHPLLKINLASKPKVKRKTNKSSKNISRKCYAVVKLKDNEFKAIVNVDGDYISEIQEGEFSNSLLVLAFTKHSLDLKGKTHVWLKYKDKYGKNVCVIRTEKDANFNPGLNTQYNVFKENLLIAGHIVRIDNIMYFEYENLIKFHYLSDYKLQDVKIDNDKPLFNK